MVTTTDELYTDRLSAIMPADWKTNRATEFAANAGILANMINRIGRTIIAGQPNAYNPFSIWTRAVMDFGDTIQRYTLPYVKGKKPDYSPENPNPFKMEKPSTQAQYWDINDGVQYKQTIQDDQLKKAFVSAGTFGSFAGAIMNNMYESVGIDQFIKWKEYLSQKDFVPATAQDGIAYTAGKEDEYGLALWKAIKTWTRDKLKYPSSKYNVMGFLTASPSVDIVITTEAKNMMDNSLAGVFNVDKIAIPGINFIEIDSFATIDQETRPLDAMILTSGMCDYTPRTPISGALYNPENYYTNYWYKEEGIFSVDLARNAVMLFRGTA